AHRARQEQQHERADSDAKAGMPSTVVAHMLSVGAQPGVASGAKSGWAPTFTATRTAGVSGVAPRAGTAVRRCLAGCGRAGRLLAVGGCPGTVGMSMGGSLSGTPMSAGTVPGGLDGGLAIGLPRGCRGDVPGRGGLLGVLEEALPGALHGERAEQYREDQCGEDTDMAGLDPWRWAQQRLDTLGNLAAGGRGRRGRRGWVGA